MSDTDARGDAFTFSAFISYARHDRADAVRLQRRLEQYRLDADLRVREGERFFPTRPLQPVFRDEDELVPGQDLPERIRKGLEASRFLIVLASRASVKSQWVEKEILDFMALGRAQNIIILVIDGVPNAVKSGKPAELECLPRPFRLKHVDGRFTDEAAVEPNWVDWRGRRRHDRINFLRLVAALLGLDRFDDLVRRDARAERRRLRFFQTVSGVFVAVALAAVGGAYLAADQLNAVRTTESKFLARLSDDVAAPEGDAMNGDHARALQLAIEGAPTATHALYPRPLTVETEAAIRRSTSHLRLRRFLAHDKEVRTAAYAPDGARLVTLSSTPLLDSKTVVRVFDAKSGTLVGKPASLAHLSFTEKLSVAFTRDGKRFVAVAGETAQVFDTISGAMIGKPMTHERDIVEARFSPDGLTAATKADFRKVRVWDANTGAPLTKSAFGFANLDLTRIAVDANNALQLMDVRTQALLGEATPYHGDANESGFSPDGARLLIVGEGKVTVRDARTGARTADWSVPGVEHASFNADSTRVITAAKTGTGGEARWWNADTGAAIGQPMRQPEQINKIAFGPDARFAATLSSNVVRLWDDTGAPAGESMSHENEPLDRVLFSPDGARLATLSDKWVKLWDLRATRRAAKRIVLPSQLADAAVSPDGGTLLVSFADSVRLYDTVTGALVDTLRHEDRTTSAAFSPDGGFVLSSSADASARVWDAARTVLQATAMKHAGDIRAVAVSPDGTLVATGSDDKTARLWRAKTGAPVGAPMTHGEGVERVVFSGDGRRLLTMGGEARLWDTTSGGFVGAPLKHAEWLTVAVFSGDGKRVATGAMDGTVRLWNAATGTAIGLPLQHAQSIKDVSFSADGARFVTVSGDDEGPFEARIWNTATAKQVGPTVRHTGRADVASVIFSPNGELILTLPEPHVAQLWNARTGAAVGKRMVHPEKIISTAISADGQRLLTVSFGEFDFSGRAQLWSTATNGTIAVMDGGSVHTARFNTNGDRIATSSWDGRARLWDGRTGALIAVMQSGPVMPFSTFAFSANGKFLATSAEGAVRLWDGRTGAAVGVPLAGEIGESSQAWAGNARIVATQGPVARAWDVATWTEAGPQLIARACAALAASGIGPLPQALRERAFRSKPTRGCAERGLLDWRFYVEALSPG